MIAFTSVLLVTLSCSPDLYDDPIPVVPFPDYAVILANETSLLTDGGYIEISASDAGVRGVILYRKNSEAFLAFEQNCSYHPNDACATVNVHTSTLYIQDACCGSTFNFDGTPTGGPAWRPLRQYATYLNAGTGTVTITDEIIN